MTQAANRQRMNRWLKNLCSSGCRQAKAVLSGALQSAPPHPALTARVCWEPRPLRTKTHEPISETSTNSSPGQETAALWRGPTLGLGHGKLKMTLELPESEDVLRTGGAKSQGLRTDCQHKNHPSSRTDHAGGGYSPQKRVNASEAATAPPHRGAPISK